MPDMYLCLCYEALFYEFPLQRLSKYRNFLWDHDVHRPQIELHHFNECFDYILEAFHRYDFALQYAETYKGTAEFRPNRPSTSQCEVKLQMLRNVITKLGYVNLQYEIDKICQTNQDKETDHELRDIRNFIFLHYSPVKIAGPTSGGAHFQMSELLRRMQDF